MIKENINDFFNDTNRIGPLLGIDLGEKRVGLSISDRTQSIASNYATLEKKKFSLFSLDLQSIIDKEIVCGIVIGLPLNMDGSEGPKCQSTRDFAKNFSNIVDIPITFWDERLTTVAAEKPLLSANLSRKKRRRVIDSVAAVLILQNLLDRLKNMQRKNV
jgi:putative Holliday junction resolvase